MVWVWALLCGGSARADIWNNGITPPFCEFGTHGPVHTQRPRVEFPVYLNQAVRFDRPGRYRFYVRSSQLLVTVGRAAPRLIPNILDLEILGRDDAWETRTLEEALNVLQTSDGLERSQDAARRIAFLGSAAAIDEMARRFEIAEPTPASERKLAELCVTDECRERLANDLSHVTRPPMISVHPSPLPEREAEFFAHEHTTARLSSRDAFYGWLGLHPEGTAFEWQDRKLWGENDPRWLPAEAERLFEETREYLRTRRMELVRRPRVLILLPLPPRLGKP